MSLLTQVFGGKYNDTQLVSTIEQTVASDPLLHDPAAVTVFSKKGVILLQGKVQSGMRKGTIGSAHSTDAHHRPGEV